MKQIIRLLTVALLLMTTTSYSIAQNTGITASPEQQNSKTQWWQDARFGMFIHWGVYSSPGRGEWLMYQEHIPFSEYALLANQFNPQKYNPKDWVAKAKAAGMKYIILTTRHHDGFCLFDSKVSDFTAPKTGAKRDLIKEFADACHEAGMRMGFYYSLKDWHFPGVLPEGAPTNPHTMKLLADQAREQIRELLTNYGKVDILWFDGLTVDGPKSWHSKELLAMARKLQPNILINDRSGLPGDFATPENKVIANSRPWESCYTMNRTWGYAPNDRNYKPVAEIIRLLASCASKNGNFLLNVSPDGEGTLPTEQTETLKKIGDWIRVNGKAIYGAGPSPVVAPNLGMTSRVGDKVYLLIQRWPGSTVPIAWCGSEVKSARLLSTGQFARIEQKGDRVWLHDLPEASPDPYLCVIELTFKGEPKGTEPPYK
ncbi:MAG: alpha-L-fucosidase [Bacteroidota bacterium]|nr:alpha-L-fucosidase [Bacteroidota bacterium]